MTLYKDLLGITPRRAGINSKNKGDTNERSLAKQLSKWSGHKFERVPASGGLGWKNSVQTVGDVVCTDNTFIPFVFETKHYKKLGLKKRCLRKNSIIFKFWEQCIRESRQSGRIPLLLIRENGMPKDSWVVFMSVAIMPTLVDTLQETEPNATISINNTSSIKCPYALHGISSDTLFKLDFKLLSHKLCRKYDLTERLL